MAMFFAIGFGLGGFESIVYVYINEISANRFRSISANVIAISWAFAQLLYPFFTKIIQNWRGVYIFLIGIPYICTIFFAFRLLKESPRFLVLFCKKSLAKNNILKQGKF